MNKSYFHVFKKVTLSLACLLFTFLNISPALFGNLAHAASNDWQHKGVSIVSQSAEDFSSADFKQTVQDAKEGGVNFVSLVFPFYQTDLTSIDIAPGFQTPSDTALINAITYVHSLGLKVMIKPHLESSTGEWRARINPSNRDGWFIAYGKMLNKYAALAKQNGVEEFCIGTELISMATYTSNPDNTQRWETMIKNVRALYSGKITYSANWGGDDFANEKDHIAFWPSLDYIGLSAYFSLSAAPNNSVDELKKAWDSWNNSDIQPLQQRWNMPIVFTEIGYRSVNDSHKDPFEFNRGGTYDPQGQVNAYEALFSYWSNFEYMQGVHLWDWKVDPDAGGVNTLEFTPQNKPAEATMKTWFTTSIATPPPLGNMTFTASARSTSVPLNQNTVIDVLVTNSSSNATVGAIVDVEIYNSLNQKVHQQFFEGQAFSAREAKSYVVNWTPTSPGEYTVKVGVFNTNWSTPYYWENNVASLTAGNAAPPPPPPASGSTVEVWWPSDGSRVSGVQPFKAMVNNMDIGQYQMFWQVDGDRLNVMGDSNEDYPHKESLVDLTGWNWKGTGPYTINFVAQNSSGQAISEKAVNIYIQL